MPYHGARVVREEHGAVEEENWARHAEESGGGQNGVVHGRLRFERLPRCWFVRAEVRRRHDVGPLY